MSRWSNIGLAILTGVLLGVSFPPSPFYSAAYVALVPFLFLLERLKSYKQVLVYTYLMALVFHAITLYWIGGFTHGRDPYLMISGAAVVFLHPGFYWLVALPYVFVRRHAGIVLGLISFPLIWLAYDYSHSLSEYSFPWISLGNSQAYDLYRIQIAEYTSIYGPALIVLVFNVLAFVLLAQVASKSWRMFSRPSILVITALVLVYLVPSFYGQRILRSREMFLGEQRIRVGLVQPNIDPWEKWGEGRASKWESYQRQLALLVAESKQLAADGADLIAWPETAIPFEILSPRYYHNWVDLKQRLDSLGVSVFTGLPTAEAFDSANAPVTAVPIRNTNVFVEYYNSATLLDATHGTTSVHPVYKKVVLVPFAERVPYAETFSFLIEPLKWSVGISGWGKGEEQWVYRVRTKDGREFTFSGMICYESVYPDFVRTFVQKGAEVLLVLTNDSWWGNTSGAYQHAAFASFRAIENRRWVIQCANGGISTFVDPTGLHRESTQMYTQARIIADVVPSREETFYARHGDLFAQVCSIAALGMVMVAVVRKFKPRNTDEESENH
ncbi:MAG TPA: apolipoprotein N-acyltransferase [Bacteroidota bacterium]|nr:apolipoprotein N-acyltransferase [Bacteroidota bacterium]